MTPASLLRRFRAMPHGGLGRELLRGGIGSGGLRAAEMVLGIIVAILLARQLGVAGLGLYAMAIAAVTLVALPIEFGLPALVTREVARAHASGDWHGINMVMWFANRMILLVAALIGAILAVLWSVFPFANEHLEILLAACAMPPLAALANVRSAALRGLRKPILGTATDGIVRPGVFVFLLGGALLLAPGWLSPAGAAALNSASTGLGLAFASITLARQLPRPSGRSAGTAPLRFWLSSAFSLGLLRGLRIVQPQILILLLGTLSTVDAAGLFRIAQRSAGLGSFGFNTVALLISPHLARLDAEGDRNRLQRLITVSAQAITASAAVPFLVVLFAGRLLLGLLFGPDFEAAYPAMVVLYLAMVVTAMLGPAQIVMAMMHREGHAATVVGGALIAAVVVCTALAPSHGALGAALAHAIGLVGLSFVLWWRANRELGLRTSMFGI